MKPYYQDKWVTIYHGDCLEIMPKLECQFCDLIITDPPYSVGVNSSGKRANYSDSSLIKPFLREFGKELFRLIRVNGAIYINTDWRTYPIWYDCLAPLEPLTNLIVWNYGWIKAGSHYRFTHEFIMFWAIGKHELTDKSTSDVWEIPPVNFTVDKLHPAEKPEALIHHILSKSNGTHILDPFLGSGTTGIVTKQRGLKFTGIEISEKYCEIAAKRCSQEAMELNI